MRGPDPQGRAPTAFTLLELLVSISLCMLLMWILLQVTNSTSKVWRDSNAKVESFQEARAAFESITRNLRQATLNTYYDYYDATWKRRGDYTSSARTAFAPTRYDRASELHFICGSATELLDELPAKIASQVVGKAVFFQAPLGKTEEDEPSDSLNALGYYLAFGDYRKNIPQHIQSADSFTPRHRFRLMYFQEPSERLGVYEVQGNGWFTSTLEQSSHLLAENIVVLVIQPMLPEKEDPTYELAPKYSYDSRVAIASSEDKFTPAPVNGTGRASTRHHQLPPIIRVAMVAVDEISMLRLQGSRGGTPAINFDDLFVDAAQFRDDLLRVEERCREAKLNYRVFTTEINLREARWSSD